MSIVPSYLEKLAAEHGDVSDELLLCLVQAVEQQTRAIENAAEWQQRTAEALEELVDRGNA